MIACTSPLGTTRSTPLRISVSSSAIFTCKLRIPSISTSLLRAAHCRPIFATGSDSRVGGPGILSIALLRHPVAVEGGARRPLRFLLARLELLDRCDEHADVVAIPSKGLLHPRQLRMGLEGLLLQGIGCCFGLQPSLFELGDIAGHFRFLH